MTVAPRFNLFGEIGFENGARLDDLTSFLAANPGPVDVFINSPGGVATEGAAMMAALERHGRAKVHVVGTAASAASLAALGGQIVLMHHAAMMMIHEPSAGTWGTADDHRSGAEALDRMTAAYASSYARATGQPVARIAAWMAAETWLTAAEAVELGFADRITGTGEGEAVAAFDYSRFRAAPQDLVQMAVSRGWAKRQAPEQEGKQDV